MATAPTVTPDRVNQVTRKTYPNYKVIVLNDDFNTFQHVAECLLKYIPGMSSDRAWDLTNQIHYEGQAIVWARPQEQAELIPPTAPTGWVDNGSSGSSLIIMTNPRMVD